MSPSKDVYGGRYEVLGRAGAGGMAEVYRARDELLGREVALKVLSERFAHDSSFIERFRREAQSAANLSHPNIVSLYDYGSDDGSYFIVMEYIDGQAVSEIIASEAPLLPERAADIASDVAGALQRAHTAGLVHRDIKPGNIMITSNGQTKVTDFGIARALGHGEQTMTQTGMVIGTASYLSPEQAQGNPVDARSDVYSLGCVLYEMLTGRVPFAGDTPLSIAYKHVREEAQPPSRLNPDVPAELDAITLKALAKNPDNRYDSASKMQEDLQRFLSGQKVLATPLLNEATTVAAPVGGTEVLRRPDTAYPAQARGGRGAGFWILLSLLILALFGLVAWALFNNLLDNPPSGAARVQVPALVGEDVARARALLEERGLESTVTRRASAGREENTVLNQDPRPGVRVERGSEVALIVSSGAPQTDVPGLRGESLESATQLLQDAGLRLGGQEEQASDDFDPGVVISTRAPSRGKGSTRARQSTWWCPVAPRTLWFPASSAPPKRRRGPSLRPRAWGSMSPRSPTTSSTRAGCSLRTQRRGPKSSRTRWSRFSSPRGPMGPSCPTSPGRTPMTPRAPSRISSAWRSTRRRRTSSAPRSRARSAAPIRSPAQWSRRGTRSRCSCNPTPATNPLDHPTGVLSASECRKRHCEAHRTPRNYFCASSRKFFSSRGPSGHSTDSG